jgi:hypothetical protein
LQFCDPTKEWSNKSPEILEFVGKALKGAADIKILTGITVSPEKVAENPIGVVGSFLGQLGLKLTRSSQRRVGQERVRFYKFGGAASANVFDRAGNKVKEPAGLRSQIFEAWQKRDELALFEFQQQGIAAVEVDVTLDLKSAYSKGCCEKDPPQPQVVTPRTIDIENIPSVTTSPAVETPIEEEVEVYPTAEKAWGWFQRGKEWIKCRVLEFVEGRYVLQAKSMVDDGVVRFWAFPEDLRWEAPT